MRQFSTSTPVGPVSVEETDGHIVRISWGYAESVEPISLVIRQAVAQLNDYFHGDSTAFDLPLAPAGSAFQQRVWLAMCEIPHGETWTYGKLAARVKTAPRAVGKACAANPIPIIIPCHRVVAADGIGGYSGSGSLKTKSALLDLENRNARLI